MVHGEASYYESVHQPPENEDETELVNRFLFPVDHTDVTNKRLQPLSLEGHLE